MRGDINDLTWIQTYTGGVIWPLDPHPDDIDIRDIAHGLALDCRYGCQCKYHYSPGLHSILVATVIKNQGYNNQMIRTALLHDGPEAFFRDMPRPIKYAMPQYVEALTRFEVVMAEKYDLHYPFPPCIKKADNDLLMTERPAVMATPPRPWTCHGNIHDDIKIVETPWREVERQFLEFYESVKA